MELLTKIIINKKFKIINFNILERKYDQLLQEKQIPNNSKLQLAAKFIYYIYPDCS